MRTRKAKFLLAAAILGSLLGAGVVLASTIPNTPAFTTDSLASGIGKTDTSMTLVRGTDGNGSILSGYYGVVIDEGTASQEVVTCTAAGTALTACARGINLVNGTSTVVALEQTHRRGASVKVTTFPVLGIIVQILQGIDTLPNLIRYVTGTSPSSSDSTALAPVSYVNGVAISGAPNSSETVNGIGQLATKSQAASSTQTGSTGARLLLPASIATSTCQVAQNSVLVSSSTSGQLDPSCFNQSASYNFTAPQIIASSTLYITNVGTLTATGTVTLNNVTLNGTATGFGTWKQLVSTTTTATMTIATTTFAAATDLHIIVHAPALSSTAICLTFNSDASAKYGDKSFSGFSGVLTQNNAGNMQIDTQIATTTDAYYTFDIVNPTAKRKLVMWNGVQSDATGDSPRTVQGYGVWNNTSAQITTIAFDVGAVCNGGAPVFGVGTSIRVYGQ